MGIIMDGIEDHEGYLGLVLDDGTTTSEWSNATASHMSGVRPLCECGWQGTAIPHGPEYPDDDEHDALLEEWSAHHARGLLVAHRLLEAARNARRAETDLREAVAASRAAGRSWSEVCAGLGVPKQAAQQRFG